MQETYLTNQTNQTQPKADYGSKKKTKPTSVEMFFIESRAKKQTNNNFDFQDGLPEKLEFQNNAASSSYSAADVDAYFIMQESGRWPKKVDGILGLAFERLNCNPVCYEPAWMKIFPSKTFTMCLGDENGLLSFPTLEDEATLASVANVVNPLATTATTSKLKHQLKVPVLGSPRTYYVVPSMGLAVVKDLSHLRSDNHPDNEINGDFLLIAKSPSVMKNHSQSKTNNNMGEAIVDSGTTLIIMPDAMWDRLVSYMQYNYCHLPGVCGSPSIFDAMDANSGQVPCLRGSPHEVFPTLAFMMGEGALLVPPSLYFIRYKEDVYCLAMQRGGMEMLVLGDALLRGFSVTYSPDAVHFSSHREEGCGKVDGLFDKDDLVVPQVKGRVHYAYVPDHGDRKFASLMIFFFVILSFYTLYKICYRRRRDYVML